MGKVSKNPVSQDSFHGVLAGMMFEPREGSFPCRLSTIEARWSLRLDEESTPAPC